MSVSLLLLHLPPLKLPYGVKFSLNLWKLPQNVTYLYILTPPPWKGFWYMDLRYFSFNWNHNNFNLGRTNWLGRSILGRTMDICANAWISLEQIKTPSIKTGFSLFKKSRGGRIRTCDRLGVNPGFSLIIA